VRTRAPRPSSEGSSVVDHGGSTPGKRTRTEALPAASGGGAPLPFLARERFETSLGADLSAVRVHDDGAAADAAAAHGAKAFATGNDIYFAAGEYQPDDPFGMHLLAHEVAHTQQQSGGSPAMQMRREGAPSSESAEVEADAAADAMVRGAPAFVSAAPIGVACFDDEEPAPEGTRDPDAIAAAPIDGLKKTLETERKDNYHVQRAMEAAIEEIDEKLKTATGTEKTELEAKRAELAPKLKVASQKVSQAEKDLEILEQGATVTPAQVNDVLARREVTAARPGTAGDVTTTRTVDSGAAAMTRSTTTTDNNLFPDGTSTTASSTSSTKVSIDGISKTDSQKSQQVKGDSTTTASSSTTTGVDWKKGAITTGSEEATTTQKGENVSGTSQKSSLTVDTTGVSASQSTTTTKGKDKSTEASSTAVTRNGGDLGMTSTSTSSTEKGDGSTTSTSVSATKGVTNGPDGVGVFGGAEGSHSRRAASGLECSGKVKAQGRAVVNVTKIDKSDPVAYQCTITINLSVSGSVGVGGSSAPDAANGGKGGVGYSGSASAVASFGYKLDEAQTKAWLEAAETGNGSGKDMQLIKVGLTETWENARALWDSWGGSSGRSIGDLQDGESTSLDITTTHGGSGSLGGKSGLGSVGIEGGHEVTHQVKGGTRRDGDKTITSFLIKDGSATSGGGSAGFGVASFGMGHKEGSSAGKGYVFTVTDKTPNADGLRAELDAIRTVDALEKFAAAHPELVGARTTTEGESSMTNEKINVGPVEIGMYHGGSFDESHTEELDADGNVVKTTDQYVGKNDLGGGVKAGPLAWGSGRQEAVDATVVTVKGPDGKDQQIASADVSKTDTSTAPDAGKSLEGVGDALTKDPLGLLTGKKPILQNDEKKEVAGVFLSDSDIETIMARASNEQAWNKSIRSPRDLDDWDECRRAIRAAKGDKVKVAEALARFQEGGHGRTEVIADTVDAHQNGGGMRYDFPNGFGQLKARFAAVVVNDPRPAIEALAKEDAAAAAKKAGQVADECDSIANTINCNAKDFTNHDQRNDMVKRLGERSAELRVRELELKAQAAGKTLDPDFLDRSKAANAWNKELDYCKECTRDEVKYFQEMSESDELTEKIRLHNELKNLHNRWKPSYAKLVELNAAYPDLGLPGWRTLKPSEQRLANANPGNAANGKPVIDPMSDEAIDAENEQSHREQQERASQAESLRYAKGLSENLTATAGMTRTASGMYVREPTEADMQEQYKQVKGRIDEQATSWADRITKARAEAAAARSNCNKLTSGGSWDPVPKGAFRPYNEGIRLMIEGDAAWKAAQAAAKATGKGVLNYFPSVQSATSAFHRATEQFKIGDAACK
jgi:hypothetical protein